MNACARKFVKSLDWDSDFFGIRTGSLNADNIPLAQLTGLLAGTDLDLVYLFKKNTSPDEKAAISRLGGIFVGERVCLRKHLEGCCPSGDVVGVSKVSDELLELAYLSGALSRFNKDCHLRKFFKPMYHVWLEKDLNNGGVFVWPSESNPKGMASVHVEGDVGRIGLVSVSESVRRKGVGRKLLNSVCEWLFLRGVLFCDVVTQGDNAAALSLYVNSGFSITSRLEIYHVWRKK